MLTPALKTLQGTPRLARYRFPHSAGCARGSRLTRVILEEYKLSTFATGEYKHIDFYSRQCLGSRFESVGSARFWLPGSGSGPAKMCGFTNPELRPGQNVKQKLKKNCFTLKTQIKTIEKREIIKIPDF